jgi:hypothetical protein
MAKISVTSSGLVPSARVGDRDIPQRYEMTWIPDEGESGIVARLVFEVREGTPECRGVYLESTEHGRQIRRVDLDVPLEDYLVFATVTVGLPGPYIQGQRREVDVSTDPFRRTVERSRRTARRRGPSDDQLREAAVLYQATNHAPTQAVADRFGIKHRTASLWISRAREKGMLQ